MLIPRNHTDPIRRNGTQDSDAIYLSSFSDRKIKMTDFTRLNLPLHPDPSRIGALPLAYAPEVVQRVQGKFQLPTIS